MRHTDHEPLAGDYDRRYSRSDYAGVERTLAERIADGTRVLEVGCGTGHWLARVRARVALAVGLDPSSAMLARARPPRGGPRRVAAVR
ncbi:MAG TPA: class I SAM-dependent methyltransferase [Haliangiales bacterium]|nr:class I SAM-dependent methyltransferase [Haliangiales bacterium]